MEIIRNTWNDLLWFVERQTYRFIIVQYLATVLLAWVPEKYWIDFYFLISNLLGYSIVSNFLIAPKIWKETKKFCEIIKGMILSLLISNVFSIFALWTSREYYVQTFDRYFLVSFTVLFYLYYFRKKQIFKSFFLK